MKFSKKSLNSALATIYNCDHYKGVDIYENHGELLFSVCPENCSTSIENSTLVGFISREHNFGPQYKLRTGFDDYCTLGSHEKYEPITKQEVIDFLKQA